MRTYTRKRPEYEVIEGVENLCRLCLGKAEAAVPIFTEDSDNVCATLPLRIMICVGLEMTREDCLPNKICKECFRELESYYTFRKKCEVTYQRLKFHMLAIKEKEFNKIAALKVESQELEVEPEVVEQPRQHLMLTFNEAQQVELVNITNLDNIQVESLQGTNSLVKVDEISEYTEVAEEDNNELQPVQDNTSTNSTLATLEIQTTTSDLSLIMSTMLIELGLLRQDDAGLALVDDSLRTVELEGDDDTKIVLRLMEEDETLEANNELVQEEIIHIPALPSLQKRPEAVLISKKEKTNECDVCGKRFASRSVLGRHRREHAGARPHACRVCDRRFAQRAVMHRHELVHRENRPFKCPSCPKSFTQRAALRAHSRRHQPAQLAIHRCAVCDKVFLYASGLSRHMALHLGRVYSCGSCARSFTDQSSLRRHKHNAHPAVPRTPAPTHAPPALAPRPTAPE